MTERIGNFLIEADGDFWLLTDLDDGQIVGTYDTDVLAREAVDRITATDGFEAFIRAETIGTYRGETVTFDGTRVRSGEFEGTRDFELNGNFRRWLTARGVVLP